MVTLDRESMLHATVREGRFAEAVEVAQSGNNVRQNVQDLDLVLAAQWTYVCSLIKTDI